MLHLIGKNKRLSEPVARQYFMQLLDAVEYMHANQIIHRDLKVIIYLKTKRLTLVVGKSISWFKYGD